jgi:hypothetical protein
MKKKRHVLYSVGIIAAVIIAVSAASLSSANGEGNQTLASPALSVMAEENGMAIAGLVGDSISFEKNDFARALNLKNVGDIIITKVPPVADGELRVGTTVVNEGQKISASSLSLMSYTASSRESTRTTFRFKTEDSSYDVPCTVYLLDKVNYAPTLENAPETTRQVSTHRNITYYGSLPCHDPDGDGTVIEIVSYPDNGILVLLDKATGEYTYTPDAGYSGKDSFTYVARDIYGNYSAAAEVSLKVAKPRTTVTFDDMSDSRYYNAALTMVEKGIMSGTQVGSDTYFYPDGTVTRGEFVVMTMHAIGVNDVTDVVSTPFADDSDIPEYMKDYISAAYELGYIKGVNTEKGMCFEANRTITRAEAAVMLGNILDVATPTVLPTFTDSADVPAWAAPSVYSVNAIGVMNTLDGNISATCAVTRADAAQILTNLMEYLD